MHKTLKTQQVDKINQFNQKLQELSKSIEQSTSAGNDEAANSKILDQFKVR